MNLIPVFGVIVTTTDVKLSKEHTEFKWCSVDEAKKLITWDQQKKGVQIFYDMITKDDNRLNLMEIQINE